MTKPPEHDAEPDAPVDPATLSYEQAVASLETIVGRIERGEIGLEESLDAYRTATELLQRCRSILDVAEQRIESVTPDVDGAEPEP